MLFTVDLNYNKQTIFVKEIGSKLLLGNPLYFISLAISSRFCGCQVKFLHANLQIHATEGQVHCTMKLLIAATWDSDKFHVVISSTFYSEIDMGVST